MNSMKRLLRWSGRGNGKLGSRKQAINSSAFDSPEKAELLAALERHKQNTCEYEECENDEVSVKISHNLFVRHKQLLWLESLTRAHQVHDKLNEEYDKKDEHTASPVHSKLPYQPIFPGYGQYESPRKNYPEERVYRLAVTDLFVEKAQAFLEERAESYLRSGKSARRVASVIIVFGAFLALFQMFNQQGVFAHSWLELTSIFTRAFTTYGMIVLAAVGFWRYSKAMLDQSERLFERRHALRQGRLFVHLNDGKLSIDELERAFKWNESQENAFANIHTEALAPWGGVLKEFAKSFPEIIKAGLQNISKGKSEDK